MAKSSERRHSQAKHHARWRLPEAEKTAHDDDQQAAWRKEYYREDRPDLDPQSTISKVLETFGLDEPYRQDVGSYDYRQKKWDESVASGNPDVSWSAPLFTDEAAQAIASAPGDFTSAIAGGPEHDRITSEETLRAMLRGELGREPRADEVKQLASMVQDDDYAKTVLADTLGRPPTEEEFQGFVAQTTDPRSRDEKMAGAAMALNPMSFFGLEDETSAAANSVLPGGGSYDDELKRARAVQKRWEEYEPSLSGRNVAATVGSLAGAWGGPLMASWDLAALGARGARTALGFAPQATSLSGRAVQAILGGAPAGAADMAAMQAGEAEGGAQNRLAAIDPNIVASGALAGGFLFPMFGAMGSGIVKGGKKTVGATGQLLKRIRKMKSAPRTPGRGESPDLMPAPSTAIADGPVAYAGGQAAPGWQMGTGGTSVRDAINSAMRQEAAARAARVPGAAVGAGILGAAGAGAYFGSGKKRRQ